MLHTATDAVPGAQSPCTWTYGTIGSGNRIVGLQGVQNGGGVGLGEPGEEGIQLQGVCRTQGQDALISGNAFPRVDLYVFRQGDGQGVSALTPGVPDVGVVKDTGR